MANSSFLNGNASIMDSPEPLPFLNKRRKVDYMSVGIPESLSTSSVSSSCGSPSSLLSPLRFFDDTFNDSSNLSSAGESPTPARRFPGKKYNKEDLWKAIQPAYQYLMDDELVETCKSTESDLSWDDDDLTINTKVSFTEFIKQYNELTEWLTQIQLVAERQGLSLCEKYLNQSYHEEMLQRSPRRKCFNDYAKQLQRRYPNMKEEIQVRLQHLNVQWENLAKLICPAEGEENDENMLRDLELDLNSLRKWLHDVENILLPLCLRHNWTKEVLEKKLIEHQVFKENLLFLSLLTW